MIPEPKKDPIKDEKSPEFSWDVLLFQLLGFKAVLIVIFILCSGVLAYFLLGNSFMWSAIAICLLLIYFGHIFVRYSFVIDDEGVSMKTWYIEKHRKWSEFRRVAVFQYGATLMTRSTESRFDFFRSLTIYLPEDKEQILSFISGKIASNKENDKSINGN